MMKKKIKIMNHNQDNNNNNKHKLNNRHRLNNRLNRLLTKILMI